MSFFFRYHAGHHGLQAAEKGTLFISLPPVLFLHLLRFQFDASSNQVQKNDSFFEFYEHIDLTDFVREDETASWKYTLFAVLSHSGGGSHGHYVAFINPSLKGIWLKFDDDTISLVHRCDAIDANFGYNRENNEWNKSMQFNAYMLVYVRDVMVKDIFETIDQTYITEELKTAVQFDSDDRHYNHSKGRHYTTDIYVFLSTWLESDFTFQFTQEERPHLLPKFSLNRDSTIIDIKHQLRSSFNLSDLNQLRIWPIVHMTCSISFPTYVDESEKLIDALSKARNKYSSYATVWVEMASPSSELLPFNPQEDVLVFYYYYSAERCRQLYVNHGYHHKNSSVATLIPILNTSMEWPNVTDLNLYSVMRDMKIEEMDGSKYVSDYMQREHDTYLLHVVFEPAEHDQSFKFPSVALFYHDLQFRVTLSIVNDDQPRPEDMPDVSLNLTFPEFLDRLARRLNYDKNKIQIFHSKAKCRDEPIPSTTTETLSVLLYGRYEKYQFFYKLHSIDVIDVETKHILPFFWLPLDLKKQQKFMLYLDDNESIDNILTEAKKLVNREQPNCSGQYRILLVEENVKLKIVRDSKEIYEYINDIKLNGKIFTFKRKHLRIEEIPVGDEICNENGEKYVTVYQSRHFASNSRTPPMLCTFSLIFKIIMAESWRETKERLRTRLNATESNWSDYRPAILIHDGVEFDIDDTKCLSEYEQLMSEFSICLYYGATEAKYPSTKLDICGDENNETNNNNDNYNDNHNNNAPYIL